MKYFLKNKIIIIPLHLSLNYPCDYIDQTAKILSKENTVIFFDYHFPYSWKGLFKNDNLKNLFISFSNILNEKKATYFRAPAVLPFSRYKAIINLNKKLGFYVLSFFLWIFKKKVIVWQFSNLVIRKVFKKQFFIYDCVDYKNSDNSDKKFFYEERILFETSDLVSFNSKGLFENKLKKSPILATKSIVTNGGCDFRSFNGNFTKIPKELVGVSQKKILFMGVFDHRVDLKLLKYIFTNNQEFKFVIIGPARKNIAKEFLKLMKKKNVLYLGEKRKNELLPFLQNCDLGIIPYNTKSKFVKYSNPMKAYEYLSCGLPMVSTNILALDSYPKDIVFTTDDGKEFSKAMKRLMGGWNNKKIIIAKNIAEKNSWDKKMFLIKKFLNGKE